MVRKGVSCCRCAATAVDVVMLFLRFPFSLLPAMALLIIMIAATAIAAVTVAAIMTAAIIFLLFDLTVIISWQWRRVHGQESPWAGVAEIAVGSFGQGLDP